MVVAKLTNMFERVCPKLMTASRISIAIKAKNMLYSTALAPVSSIKPFTSDSRVYFL
jgi:hypothetical protein